MQLSMKQKGILTIIGGFMIGLVGGSVFLWGQMNVYITSYFRQKQDQGLELSIGGAIFPVMMISMGTGVPIGIRGIKFFGSARIVCILGSIVSAIMVLIASYTERFWQFIITFGVVSGMAQGSIYFVPIYMGYLFFPNNKGMVAGIVTAGFAFCAFIFGLVFFALVNPDSLTQIKDSDGYSYFEGSSIQVARNVPEALRKMSYMYLAIGVFSAFFICYHPNQIGEEEKRLKLQLKKKEAEKQFVEVNIAKTQLQQCAQENQQMDEIHNQNNDPEERIRKCSIQILQHTLEVVKLEEQTIQKKIGLALHQDENASLNALFPKNPSPLSHLSVDKLNNQLDQNTIKKYQHFTTLQHHTCIEEQNSLPRSKQAIESPEQKQKIISQENKEIQVYVDKGGIIDLNNRILSILQSDTAENKKQHTNSVIADHIKFTSREIKREEELSKIEEDVHQKEKQAIEELESIQNREEEIKRLNKLGAPSVTHALKQPQLYLSIILGIFAAGMGMLVNGNYRSIAKDYGFTSDSFQALVGSLGGVANGISRPLWTTLLDRFSFKQIITVIFCIQIVCSFTMQLTNCNEVFFVIWVFIIHMNLGAVLGMWPVLSAQLNGVIVGAQLFGLYWYGFSLATLLQFLLVFGLNPLIGFDNLFYIYAAQSVLALLIVQFYSFKVNWSKYYIQEQKKLEIATQTDTDQKQLKIEK